MTSKKSSYPYLPPPKLQHPLGKRGLLNPPSTVRHLKARLSRTPQYFLTPSQLRRQRQYRTIIRLIFIISLLFLPLFLFYTYLVYSRHNQAPLLFSTAFSTTPNLHLLIPVTSASLLFCKSLASSIFTSYPAPILINFNSTFPQPAFARGAKLAGIANYLRDPFPSIHTLPTTDSDLVLIVDGFDVWYQLPPDILLLRYTHFNRNPVVFGADKLCWPNSASSSACRLPPESTLPRDAYGENVTDRDPSGYMVRPRYLNSGTVLGVWKGVNDVYLRAMDIGMRKKGRIWSDQGVLAEVWGQELERKEAANEELKRVTEEGTTISGMVMDYESQLFMTMTHAHGDLQWRTVSVSSSPIDADSSISSTLFPAPPPPQLSLATNIISNSTPALLHFNGMKFPLGSDADSGWWGRMWWFHLFPDAATPEEQGHRAREVFMKHIERVRNLAAESGGLGIDGRQGRFGGVWTDAGVWMEWGDICGEWDFVGRGGVWGV